MPTETLTPPARSAVTAACFFVQARYGDGAGDGERWRTVAAASRRGVAIQYAADVYRLARPPFAAPEQVRVVSEAALRAHAGELAVVEAFRDVRASAERIVALNPA